MHDIIEFFNKQTYDFEAVFAGKQGQNLKNTPGWTQQDRSRTPSTRIWSNNSSLIESFQLRHSIHWSTRLEFLKKSLWVKKRRALFSFSDLGGQLLKP